MSIQGTYDIRILKVETIIKALEAIQSDEEIKEKEIEISSLKHEKLLQFNDFKVI